MNELNRSIIVLFCGIVFMLMAIVVFLTWSANTEVIDALFDAVEYLDDNNDEVGRLIVTLGAMIIAVAALLIIILELAPEDEVKELKVRQAGSTTIVPAQALRDRLEEALLLLPDVTAADVIVRTKDEGIAAELDLTIRRDANVAHVTQESTRVVIDAVQEDLGLPVRGTPLVRVAFDESTPAPVTSSVSKAPDPSAPEASAGTEAPPDYSQFQRPATDAPQSETADAPPPDEPQQSAADVDRDDRPQS